jgi:hypothetical protein
LSFDDYNFHALILVLHLLFYFHFILSAGRTIKQKDCVKTFCIKKYSITVSNFLLHK